MEPKGGVAKYIRQQRLLAAYTMISDPSNRLSIQQIAEGLCVAGGSSFSRAFRQEFGISPREIQAMSAALSPPPGHSDTVMSLYQLLASARN